MTGRRATIALRLLAAVLACAARGGAVRGGDMGTMRICVIPYADAGRACTDSDRCAGRCLFDYGRRAYSLEGPPPVGPAAGRCEADDGTLGCLSEVRNGRVQRPTCTD